MKGKTRFSKPSDSTKRMWTGLFIRLFSPAIQLIKRGWEWVDLTWRLDERTFTIFNGKPTVRSIFSFAQVVTQPFTSMFFFQVPHLWQFIAAASWMQAGRAFCVPISARTSPRFIAAWSGITLTCDVSLSWQITRLWSLRGRFPRIIWSRPWAFKSVLNAARWWSESTKRTSEWFVRCAVKTKENLTTSAGIAFMSGLTNPAHLNVVSVWCSCAFLC